MYLGVGWGGVGRAAAAGPALERETSREHEHGVRTMPLLNSGSNAAVAAAATMLLQPWCCRACCCWIYPTQRACSKPLTMRSRRFQVRCAATSGCTAAERSTSYSDPREQYSAHSLGQKMGHRRQGEPCMCTETFQPQPAAPAHHAPVISAGGITTSPMMRLTLG